MGERKGQNKYYPPDFDYRKHKSLDAYHGSHPLRERAKKLGQGILVIRFEMPYNIWCDGCGNHIGMGVRYNAEKSKIGNYYTTPIYKFRMKCHLCPSYIEIKTDPAAHDYVIISGARRKEQRWDPKENEQIVTDDKEMQKKLARDAMYRLEHVAGDTAKQKAARPGVAQLTEHREARKDDYMMNKLARNMFRTEKKLMKAAVDEDNALLKKSSLDIKLVAENEDDLNMVQLFKYRTVSSFDEKHKEKRDEIINRPLFSSPANIPDAAVGPSPDRRQRLGKLAGRLGINRQTNHFSATHVKSAPGNAAHQLVRTSRTAAVASPSGANDCERPGLVGAEVGDRLGGDDVRSNALAESSDGALTERSTSAEIDSTQNDNCSMPASAGSSTALLGLGLAYDSSNSSSGDETKAG